MQRMCSPPRNDRLPRAPFEHATAAARGDGGAVAIHSTYRRPRLTAPSARPADGALCGAHEVGAKGSGWAGGGGQERHKLCSLAHMATNVAA